MLKTTRLFGVEQKDQKVYFIGVDGEGYWFTSHGEKTVGEIKSLRSITERIEAQDMASSWLIVDIVKKQRNLIISQFFKLNPFNLSTQELQLLIPKELLNIANERKELSFEKQSELISRDLNIQLEQYVRSLIRNVDLFNPILEPFGHQITASISSALMLDYQLEVARTAFNYRVVTDTSVIKVDTEDPEKGYITLKDFLSGEYVGYEDVDLNKISETLALRIYEFMSADFRGEKIITSKVKQQLEEEVKKEAELTRKDEPMQEVYEKKPNAKNLQRQKTEATVV
jgi:hypothetical protein